MRDTIDMAREAGFETMITKGKIHGFDRDGDYTEELKAFEALIRADERAITAPVQEPVGCMRCATPKKCATWGCSPNTWPSENTTPPAAQLQWVGLTAKDLSEIPARCYEGAIWADAKLKEKNT